ncbi:hypothetical protein [Lentibacillus persicus]|uniref:hypothetical protein n=1 Tax=Lentibacillus persicus TaxID=640948 RepID=UPI001FE0A790|nr:hypothetical protein [Lentibacillus persicus]
MSIDWSGGQSTPAGKQRLKIPQEAVFASEEAEALPAESDCPQRKSMLSLPRSLHQLRTREYKKVFSV